jgi:hypothetical protein
VETILLAAMGRALCQELQLTSLKVSLEKSGRVEDLMNTDLSRTVGWMTVIHPINIPSSLESVSILQDLFQLQDDLKKVPDDGIGYGWLRSKTNNDQFLVFNYQGGLTEREENGDGNFELCDWTTGSDYDASFTRSNEFDFFARWEKGILKMIY